MNDIQFCNTKEGIHEAAKKNGLTPYSLGCSCEDCCREFGELLSNIRIPGRRLTNPNYIEHNGESYVKTNYALSQMQLCSEQSVASTAKFVLQWTGDQELYDQIIKIGAGK